jgi:hypothetical protein
MPLSLNCLAGGAGYEKLEEQASSQPFLDTNIDTHLAAAGV